MQPPLPDERDVCSSGNRKVNAAVTFSLALAGAPWAPPGRHAAVGLRVGAAPNGDGAAVSWVLPGSETGGFRWFLLLLFSLIVGGVDEAVCQNTIDSREPAYTKRVCRQPGRAAMETTSTFLHLPR